MLSKSSFFNSSRSFRFAYRWYCALFCSTRRTLDASRLNEEHRSLLLTIDTSQASKWPLKGWFDPKIVACALTWSFHLSKKSCIVIFHAFYWNINFQAWYGNFKKYLMRTPEESNWEEKFSFWFFFLDRIFKNWKRKRKNWGYLFRLIYKCVPVNISSSY